MSSDVVIQVLNLSKCYKIYERPIDRLKESILPRLQRLVGHTPKTYGRDFWALRDVSLGIRRGETVGIIGRNGSGKSTLLQMICGTLTPTSGTIHVQGRVAALLELGAGFHPEFTGRENVYMNGAILGLSVKEIDQRFDSIAAFADIGEFIDQPVKTYSSGMYVRLAFAVMVHVDADVLVVDEALAVGDAFFVQKCMRFLRDFMTHGAILFVSHDTGAILNLCDRAVLLEGGGVQREGTAKAICDEYCQLQYESQQGPARFGTDGQHVSRGVVVGSSARELSGPEDADGLSAPPAGTEMFGTGQASIEDVTLRSVNGRDVRTVIQREKLVLTVTCRTTIVLFSPIVGFTVRDRLGQALFGNNTFLTYCANPMRIEADALFSVEFEFWMPMLRQGDYSITVALAEGTQQHHVQHHWIHDALGFKSLPRETCFGSIGIETVLVTARIEGSAKRIDEAINSAAL
jgi:lipopolysaccharide transport system ATP-binding protein